MKITIGGNVIEGTPEELAEYFAMTEDLAKADSCEDACCGDAATSVEPETTTQRELQKGDIITINFPEWDNEGNTVDLTEGKRYKIVYDSNNDELGFYDDVNYFRYSPLENPATYNIVGEVEETIEADAVITFEGDEYRKVDREAREGDVVVFRVNETRAFHSTTNKPYKVIGKINGEPHFIGDSETEYSVYTNDHNRTPETTDVYEPVAVEKPKETKSYEPKVGDIVVVTANTNSSRNDVGDIGKVGGYIISVGADVHVPGKTKGSGNFTLSKEMRPATAEEIAQYEKAVADAEEEAKWAKLGRKVGEYKKGDIVRIVGQYGGDHVEGAIGVVKYDDTTDAHTPPVIAVCSDGTIDDYFAKVELVAPAESVLTHN